MRAIICLAYFVLALSSRDIFAQAIFRDDELSADILTAGEEVSETDIQSKLARHGVTVLDNAVFPVKSGAKILSRFGDPRPNGRRHEGIDLGNARGTPILAAWAGVVAYSHWDQLGGWSVKLRHANGLATYYAHQNEKSPLHVGQVVKAGGHVGVIGNSGDAKGIATHLHFGIYKGGGALNPSPYLYGK